MTPAGGASGAQDFRAPAVAGLFYPASKGDCLRDLDRCLSSGLEGGTPPAGAVGAVAPHAGWTYSGPLAALAVAALEGRSPDTVLLFGADHHGLLRGAASVHPGLRWGTPLGEVEVDGEVAAALAADPSCRAVLSADAHGPEHSIEVLVPFLRARLPAARILPVVVPPACGGAAVGRAAVRAAVGLGRRCAVLGSTDLTHYGSRYGFAPEGVGDAAHRWSMEENDRDILERVLAFDPEGIERSARARRNACGPGALAAVTAAARELGATRAEVLRHTSSAEVMGERDPSLWVGYAAVAFLP